MSKVSGSFAKTKTVSFVGVSTKLVEVQVSLAPGQPSLSIVGLPGKSVNESRDRIRSAISSIGLSLPPKRITVNLSPANIAKEGSHYDLPITIALLAGMGTIDPELAESFMSLGELTLDAKINYVPGVLPAAIAAKEHGLGLICPKSAVYEASFVIGGVNIYPVDSLLTLINFLTNRQNIEQPKLEDINIEQSEFNALNDCLSNIRGQELAKRAIEIAASGGHNIIMVGSPGTGKSMLARAMAGLLPELDFDEILEVLMVRSVAGELQDTKFTNKRPFRSPHHSSSIPAIVGGGRVSKPGEISLAHNGILFLDELAEFPISVLDSLRQPLETGTIEVARAEMHVSYPAKFQLVAAMNPCKCGYIWEKSRACNKIPMCGEAYMNKISGPIMERIDLQVAIQNPGVDLFDGDDIQREKSTDVIKRVKRTREIQKQRFKDIPNIKLNKDIAGQWFEKFCILDEETKLAFSKASKMHLFSMREHHKILRVARTIADMEESSNICKNHLLEALSYRI